MNRSDVERALAQFPELTHFGFGVPEKPALSGAARERAIKKGRADLLTHVDECTRAESWLCGARRTKSVNRRNHSYGYKHDAENAAGGYVANGSLIAAAVHLGFLVRQVGSSPNAYLNISMRWLEAERAKRRAARGG